MFESEEEKLAYLDKGFDEVFVNLVGIKIVCSKYHSLFPSKSKLHKHIKSEYVGEILLFVFPYLSSSISVIVSKAVHIFLRSGFGFRN